MMPSKMFLLKFKKSCIKTGYKNSKNAFLYENINISKMW